MPTNRSRRLPRAGIDRIADELTALDLLDAVITRPSRHETVLVLLDDDRCGIGLVVVDGTVDADDVVEVAERVLDPAVHEGRVAGVIVASVRPEHSDDGGWSDTGSADRWLALDEIAHGSCVELVEWLVLGRRVSRPRELVAVPARW